MYVSHLEKLKELIIWFLQAYTVSFGGAKRTSLKTKLFPLSTSFIEYLLIM